MRTSYSTTSFTVVTCAAARRGAPQVANSYCDWLQDTSLLVSERWPALDGGVRLDVRGSGERPLSPRPAAR